MCTHILEIADKLCKRVMVMDKGKVLARGKVGDIEERKGEGLEGIFHRLVGK
jgi:ABC-2 type transport system ATP-binding protein